MYKRLIILSVIIFTAMCGLIGLGYHSIRIRAQGMEGARLGEFAAVAEQIRQDVTRKLDEFMQTEQNRPYTDYQYYYVPENIAPGQQQQQMPVLRSPLAGRLENGLAYGNFQIEPDGSIITPNDFLEQNQRQDAIVAKNELFEDVLSNRKNIGDNLLPALDGTTASSFKLNMRNENRVATPTRPRTYGRAGSSRATKSKLPQGQQGKDYLIESLQNRGQKAQVLERQRAIVELNVSNSAIQTQQMLKEETAQERFQRSAPTSPPSISPVVVGQAEDFYDSLQTPSQESQSETVQVRIEPFVPVVVPADPNVKSVFGGQVFLLRHVQIEDRHFIQGFRLNEKKLIEEIQESASRFMREGMNFNLLQNGTDQEDHDVAYAAILSFGFGDLVLNLNEVDPNWIGKRISTLRTWYFSIVSVVLLAVTLGLVSLWRNARAQLKLAQKKDDFISA
ncbi:MAG: hypothetical protein JXM79_15335, partial [Sedimentisphaerales bacterium]|nr:hypothetical protein [Sedimentisphaerales bacterium]